MRPSALTRPHDLRGLGRNLKIIAYCTKAPDQIVMQMERFRFPTGNPVDIDSRQKRRMFRIELNSCFFDSLTRRRRIERRIAFFHVSARQEPPEQTMMMNHQYSRLAGMENQRRAGDMSGRKLIRRKRLRGVTEQKGHQILALRRQAVLSRIKIRHHLQRCFPGDRHCRSNARPPWRPSPTALFSALPPYNSRHRHVSEWIERG